MVRRKKEKKKRPAWGIPKGIVLLATPEGWRTSVLTVEGGMLCGRLDIPINTDPQDARAAAAVMVTELARDFHDTDVQVHWVRPRSPGHGPPKSSSPPGKNLLRRLPRVKRLPNQEVKPPR
ncbi:hypothetical protein ACIPY6_40810 [Streptomyces sp. NPDC090054]|uniref:hypothetical protein n=1 Tax=Streptomyces sp. NPDC090054 TaxID=3365933 RepID=UPI0038121587